MACGPLFHLLCIWLAIASLLHFLFRNLAASQWWVANDLDKYDTHVFTLSCFISNSSTIALSKAFKWWNLVSHVYILGKVADAREHIFFLKINGVGKPWNFSTSNDLQYTVFILQSGLLCNYIMCPLFHSWSEIFTNFRDFVKIKF